MAFPTVVAAGTPLNAFANTTSKSVTCPAASAGDRLILMMCWDGAPSISSITAVNGQSWVQVFTSGTISSTFRFYVYEIVALTADVSPANLTVNISASESGAAQIIAVDGSHETQAIEASSVVSATNTAPNPGPLTPTWGAEDTLWIAAFGMDSDWTIVSYPTNYTNGVSHSLVNTGHAGFAYARREINATSEDPGAFATDTSDGWGATTLGIRPAAVPPPVYQLIQPVADLSPSGWTPTPLWSRLDDHDEADFIETTSTSSFGNVLLATAIDPQISDNHTLRVRARIASGTGTLVLNLYNSTGGTNWIGDSPFWDLTTSWQTFEWTLNTTQTNNITDYSALQVRHIGNAVGIQVAWSEMAIGTPPVAYGRITWAELKVPGSESTPVNPQHLITLTEIAEPTLTQQHIVAVNPLSLTTVISEPTITQQHFLTANGLESTTVISEPTISQTHVVAPNALDVATEISPPDITQFVAVDPQDAATETVISSPALIQQHILTSDDLESFTVISSPTLLQTHVLQPEVLVTETNISSPFVGILYFTFPNDLETITEISEPTISQLHIVQPNALVADTVISESVISEIKFIQPNSLDVETVISESTLILQTVAGITWLQVVFPEAAPQEGATPQSLNVNTVISSPAITQQHFITIDSLESVTIISEPVLSVTGAASPQSLIAETEISSPSLTQQHFVTVNALETITSISSPVVSVTGAAQPNSPVVNTFISQLTLTQKHFITPNSLQSLTVASEPIVAPVASIQPNNLTSIPAISLPTITQKHFLSSNSLESETTITQPIVSVTGFPNPNPMSLATVISQPTLTQEHFVFPNSLVTITAIQQPSLLVTIGITPNSLVATTAVSSPSTVEVHVTAPNSLNVTTQIQQPSIIVFTAITPEHLESITTISRPSLSQQHFVFPSSIEVITEISQTEPTPPIKGAPGTGGTLIIGGVGTKNVKTGSYNSLRITRSLAGQVGTSSKNVIKVPTQGKKNV